MHRFIQKLSVIIGSLSALTLMAIPLVSSPVVQAAGNPGGTCFVTDPSGSKTHACTKADKAAIKNAGKTFNASKCYSITSTTSTTNVAIADCSGKGSAGTQMCTDPSTGKDVACATCDDGSFVADASQCPENAQDKAADKDSDCGTVTKCDLVSKYINPFVNFLSALVGVAVTISLVVGGIRYASSAGDPQATAAAKTRIRNAIIALVTFIFLYALLNFLIPGGLL